MKKIIRIALLLCIVCSMVLSPVSTVFAKDYMAYNIYSDPITSKTSGRFDTFTIEFRGIQTPNYTYWALANFALDLSSIKTLRTYPGITGGGAYAGLQDRSPTQGKAAIMSFWEMRYLKNKESTRLDVQQMYPYGQDTNFGGEGEGKSAIVPYNWDDNTWYRMVIHTWDDIETCTTFAGQWFQNMETGEWTLTIYYNTNVYDSCFKGGMGLFQENYINTYEEEREFNTKNIYAIDHKTGKWVSLASCNVSYGNGGAANKAGAHSFGATEEYFWGKAGGVVEDQDAYEKQAVKSKILTIKQPEAPTFTTPKINSLTIDGNNVAWEISKTDMPQLSYKLEVVDVDGKTLFTKEQTRPEMRTATIEGVTTDAYKCILTVTDLLGEKTVMETATDAYKAAVSEPTDAPETTQAPETSTEDTTVAPAATPETVAPNNTGLVIGICAGAAIVVGGVVAAVIITKKKKK